MKYDDMYIFDWDLNEWLQTDKYTWLLYMIWFGLVWSGFAGMRLLTQHGRGAYIDNPKTHGNIGSKFQYLLYLTCFVYLSCLFLCVFSVSWWSLCICLYLICCIRCWMKMYFEIYTWHVHIVWLIINMMYVYECV